MPHDARAVANLVLEFADESDTRVSHLALQKVLFFIHGWYLARTAKPFIKQAFEAWDHGPVARVVYDEFKSTPKGQPIEMRAYVFDLVLRDRVFATSEFTESERNFVREIVSYYARINASGLRNLTHVENGAWDLVYNAKVFSIGGIIDDYLIKEYFDGMAKLQHEN